MEKIKSQETGDNFNDHKNQLENNNNAAFGVNNSLMKDTCTVHKGARLDYFCVDSQQNFVFKCMYCVTDDNINQLTLIPIEQVLTADSKTVFANFPLQDRDLTREIKQIAQSPPTGAIIQQQIDTFFKDFRAQLMGRIDQLQQKMVEKAQSISDFCDVLLSNYNRVSPKERIQSIIADRHKPIESKSTELKDICGETLSKIKVEENTQLFTQLINSMKTLEKATDFETPKLISESILKQLESINMFLVDDIAQLQRQLLTNYPNQLHREEKSLNPALDAVENLMKLVRNKLNDVSSDSCKQLETQLKHYSFIISQLNVPVPGPVYESLQSFDEDETQVFKGLICDVATAKQVLANKDGNLSEIEGDNGKESESEKLSSEEITELVNNRTNFCSPEFIEDFSKVMITISGLLGLFQVRKSRSKSDERAAFNSLNKKQLEDFVKLAFQVNLFTHHHSELYLNSKYPQHQIQPNSTNLIKTIGNNLILKRGTAEEKAQSKMDLEKLLVSYPIFELLPNLASLKLLPLNFSRTKYGNSSEIGITEKGNEVEVTFPNCAGKIGQVVSETLKNESGYRIRLKFNHPYGKHGSGHFRIGLTPNSSFDSGYILPNSNFSGLHSCANYGVEIVTKGSRLCSEPLRSETNELEMRWCISKRQFFISDSTYLNVNQAKEGHFTPTDIYCFGVCFFYIPESDWKVTISEFSEIDPAEVPLFE